MDRVEELTYQLLDDVISDAEFDELRALVESDPIAEDLFCHMLRLEGELRGERQMDLTASIMQRLEERLSERAEHRVMDAVWAVDAARTLSTGHEKTRSTSTAHELKFDDQRQLQDAGGSDVPATPHVNWSGAAAILVATGLLVSLLFVVVNNNQSPGTDPPTLAVLNRTVGASWAGHTPAAGDNLSVGTLKLTAGLAEIEFDRGAIVIVQGPAEIQLLSNQRCRLSHGRLVALVPPPAHGFTVESDDLTVVDLGTEFAMNVTIEGRSEVHVFRGEVEAHANKKQFSLKQDNALRVDRQKAAVEKMAAQPSQFVRNIGIRVDLADIVGGGNGLGTGRPDQGIDVSTGEAFWDPDPRQARGQVGFHPVNWSTLIDGVILPHHNQDAALDSAQHVARFPSTVHGSWDGIRNGRIHASKTDGPVPHRLNGVDYTAGGHTCIGMHANAGIAFDLRAIAQAHDGQRPVRFSAMVGNVNEGARGKGTANVFIFVDGQLRYSRREFNHGDGGERVEVGLDSDARFLTLVTTQATGGFANDWVIYGDAKVDMEPQQ